jgi:hypothetical protein
LVVKFELNEQRICKKNRRAAQRGFLIQGRRKVFISPNSLARSLSDLTFPNRKRAWVVSKHSWREWNHPPSNSRVTSENLLRMCEEMSDIVLLYAVMHIYPTTIYIDVASQGSCSGVPVIRIRLWRSSFLELAPTVFFKIIRYCILKKDQILFKRKFLYNVLRVTTYDCLLLLWYHKTKYLMSEDVAGHIRLFVWNRVWTWNDTKLDKNPAYVLKGWHAVSSPHFPRVRTKHDWSLYSIKGRTVRVSCGYMPDDMTGQICFFNISNLNII